jgi:GNAT superfamily N-acetyltransferase
VRGQRLFVRSIQPSDAGEVHAFLARHSAGIDSIPARGLLGKLVGDLVAVMAISITADSVRIDDLTVASGLRRKRIGRVMVGEALQLAKQMNHKQLAVDDPRGAIEFFRHVGFVSEGPRLVMRVG